MKQLTLSQSFTLSGKGLHTGAMVDATVMPAPEGHGYKFQRTDLEGEPVIDALAENVLSTQRGTVLGRGDVTVSTVEHLLAALYACGVDNALIRVNAPEAPILDGSSRLWLDAIEAAGLTEQKADKDYYIVKHKIEVADEESGSKILILPDDEFSVEVKVNFESPVLSNQYASMEHIEDFGSEIAGSRTFVFVREIEPLASAIVDIMLPGNYGGDALAQLLAGKRNFSARLPFTYPKWINAIATYDHKPCETVATMSGAYNYNADIDVQWPFGFGMSYTTFEYSDIAVDKAEFAPADSLTVSVKVTNTSKMAGKETVLLYSSDLVASLSPDVLRVRGFEKVDLQPGQSTVVSFTIPASDLAFVNYDGKWVLEKGEFEFTLGNLKAKTACTETKTWNTPNI